MPANRGLMMSDSRYAGVAPSLLCFQESSKSNSRSVRYRLLWCKRVLLRVPVYPPVQGKDHSSPPKKADQ